MQLHVENTTLNSTAFVVEWTLSDGEINILKDTSNSFVFGIVEYFIVLHVYIDDCLCEEYQARLMDKSLLLSINKPGKFTIRSYLIYSIDKGNYRAYSREIIQSLHCSHNERESFDAHQLHWQELLVARFGNKNLQNNSSFYSEVEILCPNDVFVERPPRWIHLLLFVGSLIVPFKLCEAEYKKAFDKALFAK